MAAIATLAAVSLDTSDPALLAGFYRELLDLEVMFDSEDFTALRGAGDAQPSPELWRVLVDPAGHPFCITTLIPDA
ncbi:MAG: hypothetical protein ACXV8R_07005 [Acidimicrobiia bacterium]